MSLFIAKAIIWIIGIRVIISGVQLLRDWAKELIKWGSPTAVFARRRARMVAAGDGKDKPTEKETE